MSRLLFIMLFISVLGIHQGNYAQASKTEKTQKFDNLPSGFYLVNNSIGQKINLKNSTQYFYVNPTLSIPIINIDKVKYTVIKTRYFGKTEKTYGLSFYLNKKGSDEMQQASKKAIETDQKMGILIDNQLIFEPFYVNSEIKGNTFFLDLNMIKESLKNLEKIIKKEIKN